MYNPHARKTFEEDVRAYDFKLKEPLSHAERRREGLLFFLAPNKEPVSSPHGPRAVDRRARATCLSQSQLDNPPTVRRD
jgi:hypothetical protein